nr:DTW domain-containing protein 2 isoform X1 [Loxodonta africana]
MWPAFNMGGLSGKASGLSLTVCPEAGSCLSDLQFLGLELEAYLPSCVQILGLSVFAAFEPEPHCLTCQSWVHQLLWLHESGEASVLTHGLGMFQPLQLREPFPCRPQKVCLCPFLPVHPLHISTHLYIIQHPAEENKVLRTVPLLAACLPKDKCKVKIGRRFSEERDPELSAVCQKSGTLILYPGAEAANLEEFILDSPVYPSTIIIIDGTWSQAKDIFYKNSLFRLPKQVQLKTSISSQYVIRMQPTNSCLSTLECAAVALSILEKNNYIQEVRLWKVIAFESRSLFIFYVENLEMCNLLNL